MGTVGTAALLSPSRPIVRRRRLRSEGGELGAGRYRSCRRRPSDTGAGCRYTRGGPPSSGDSRLTRRLLRDCRSLWALASSWRAGNGGADGLEGCRRRGSARDRRAGTPVGSVVGRGSWKTSDTLTGPGPPCLPGVAEPCQQRGAGRRQSRSAQPSQRRYPAGTPLNPLTPATAAARYRSV